MARRGPKPSYLKLVGAADAVRDLDTGLCGSVETWTGNPCKRRAGWGTSHSGEGPCRDHSERGVPGCPEPLGEAEAAVWRQLAPEMRRLGLLKQVFWPVMVALCEAIVLRRLTRAAIDGMIVESAKGEKKNPAFTMWKQAAQEIRSLSAELGITPSALAKIGTVEEEGESPVGELIRGR